MKRIANEKKYVEDMINNKTLNKNRPGKDLNSLIKYLYECNPQIKKNELIEQVNNILFDIVQDKKAITRWQVSIKEYVENFLSSVQKFKGLSHVEKICITETELQKIQQLNNKKLEYVAFALLVYLKINNSIKGNLDNTYCPSNDSDLKIIKNIAGPKMSVNSVALLMNELQKLGYTVNGIGGAVSCKLEYIDNNSSVVIEITDFTLNNIHLYYKQKISNGRIIHCKECGQVFLIKNQYNRSAKYCTTCSKTILSKQQAEYYKRKKE